MMIPTNGRLMTVEEFQALENHVRAAGTDFEKAMLLQMNVMVNGMVAISNLKKQEEKCRQFAESQVHELARRNKLARLALSSPLSSLNKTDLKRMIEMAREQLDETVSEGNGTE